MAITSSAKKALRVSRRRQLVNKRRKEAMVDVVKNVKKFVAQKQPAQAAKLLAAAYQAIDKSVKVNIINKNAAARKKSRLAALIKMAS